MISFILLYNLYIIGSRASCFGLLGVAILTSEASSRQECSFYCLLLHRVSILTGSAIPPARNILAVEIRTIACSQYFAKSKYQFSWHSLKSQHFLPELQQVQMHVWPQQDLLTLMACNSTGRQGFGLPWVPPQARCRVKSEKLPQGEGMRLSIRAVISWLDTMRIGRQAHRNVDC